MNLWQKEKAEKAEKVRGLQLEREEAGPLEHNIKNCLKDNITKRHFSSSDELCSYVSEMFSTVILSFSCGKESIASFITLRKYFRNVIPFYAYIVPHLDFIDEAILYYEEVFHTKIIQLPHPSLYRMLNNLVFQAPENCHIIEEMNIASYDYEELYEIIKKECGLPRDTFTAIGVRGNDPLMRRISIKKHGPINYKKRTFYPIYDWNNARLIECFVSEGVKLPIDYKLFGRSFDGIDYRFLKPIKENFIKDYEKILSYFPLAELEIKRMEWREKYYGQSKEKVEKWMN